MVRNQRRSKAGDAPQSDTRSTIRAEHTSAHNLLREAWINLDSHELRLLLDARIGGPGQYLARSDNPETLYLPLAGSSCRVLLKFRDNKITVVEPGPAFDSAEWQRISEEIARDILVGPIKVGREYSFSSFRVNGSWRGDDSGVQILSPPRDAPIAPVEMADHPFILEFPMQAAHFWPVTNHRRLRGHRNLTLLLNVLLPGRTSFQSRRSDHFWASVSCNPGPEIKWVQQLFFAKLGDSVVDNLSPPASELVEQVEPQEFEKVGHDGKSFRVPADLDRSICLYLQLSPPDRAKFDRASFWFDMAARQWTVSVSSSFASLVSAVESLTDRGTGHRVYCEECKDYRQHEVPGAVERFRVFFEKYAPGATLRSRRTKMYDLRSGILHGSELMQLDQDLAFGWDPPGWSEHELHEELWGVTRTVLRNWLNESRNNLIALQNPV